MQATRLLLPFGCAMMYVWLAVAAFKDVPTAYSTVLYGLDVSETVYSTGKYILADYGFLDVQ